MKQIQLSDINSPQDIKQCSISDLERLAFEIRSYIIDIVSENGGHLGSALGVTELTLALHYVFDVPSDSLVWDVGHQAYVHKIITGRRQLFPTNRKWKGISGFPSLEESVYDGFGTGHASTAISAVLGKALAAQLSGNDQSQHIAVVGDASIVGGMSFEAMNHAGDVQPNILVILNDNAIGIDPSVGAIKKYLATLSSEKKEANTLFSALDFYYEGPVNGHNMTELISCLQKLKNQKGAKLLHVRTVKGKGLRLAELEQVRFHAPERFDPISGKILSQVVKGKKYQDIFGETLVRLSEDNSKIVVITPAMPTGSGLIPMLETFPERTFDVGIAEQHAVTFSAGLASAGMLPFCVIYSTFLQRAYDQIIHDVALQRLGVVFCIDRAGLVGNDGATHHGVFDIPYLLCIPNLVIASPRNGKELQNMLYTAQKGKHLPMAIRYPRAIDEEYSSLEQYQELPLKSECVKKGNRIAVISVGSIFKNVKSAIDSLHNSGDFSIYDLRFIKPLDEPQLHLIAQTYEKIVTVEESVLMGGVGSLIATFLIDNQYYTPLYRLGIPDRFISHGSIEALQAEVGLDKEGLRKYFSEL